MQEQLDDKNVFVFVFPKSKHEMTQSEKSGHGSSLVVWEALAATSGLSP